MDLSVKFWTVYSAPLRSLAAATLLLTPADTKRSGAAQEAAPRGRQVPELWVPAQRQQLDLFPQSH